MKRILLVLIFLFSSGVFSQSFSQPLPCIDPALIDSFAICPLIYAPVCGCNGIQYDNSCLAEKLGGVTTFANGPCTSGACQSDFDYILMSAPNSVAFFDSSTNGPFASWFWTFGDGNSSSLQNPTHMYTQPGIYTACLTVVSLNGCVSSFCQTINLAITPCVDSTQIDSSTICITLYAPVCGCNGVTYSNSCIAQFYGGVTSWTTGPCGTGGGCQSYYNYQFGINPLGVIFTDSSSTSTPNDPIISWLWDFGDGTVSAMQNPNHLYSAPGTYVVCLTITSLNGCTDTYCLSIPIATTGGCQAAFSYIPDSTATPSFTFINNSSGTAPLTYVWDFGDGSVSNLENPSHMYNNTGTYTVCLTITDSTGCTDSTCTVITISGGCISDFIYNVSPSGNVVFTNQSIGSGNLTYVWDLGDGTNSNQQDPQHFYNSGGVYYVCLTITDGLGCTDTYCDSISVVIQGISDLTDKNFNLIAFPNPFEEQTSIQYELPNSAIINLAVYDALGNKLEQLLIEKQFAGKHTYNWDAQKYTSGMYFISLKVNDKSMSTKVTLMK